MWKLKDILCIVSISTDPKNESVDKKRSRKRHRNKKGGILYYLINSGLYETPYFI